MRDQLYNTFTRLRAPTAASIIGILVFSFITTDVAQAAPVTGFNAGRIIDDAVFTNKNSMSVGQIQTFLNAKGVNCTNGESPCLKNFNEGGRSAAQIFYDTGQQYNINPQTLIVLVQKEVGLVTANQPGTWRYTSATGYGCPDSSPGVCNANYRGFTNQVRWAATMYHAIMTDDPNWYTPYNLGNNNIRWNPSASCGSSVVNIENRATKALYNYTPYRPNQAALNAGYGLGDSCSSYGNRNFYLYFSDWFGNTNIFDPYGWNLIKTADDARTYLVVGNTKRWIPSGEIFNDWNLDIKPVETVSQGALDAIPTIPPLDRLGYYDNKYFYVDGGKRYWLSNAALQRAWGQANNLGIAAPAYIPLSTLLDGGEATFYVSLPSESKVARMVNGQKYMINAADADRWHANPTILTSSAFNSTSVAATLDYHVSVNGIKYVVDDGRLLNVNSSGLLRDYSQTNNTFVNMPDEILGYLPTRNVTPLVQIAGSGAWYVLRGGERYYLPTANHARAWNIGGEPTVISPRLSGGLPQSAMTTLPLIAQDSGNGKTYLLDGNKHELTGAMLDAAKPVPGAFPALSSEYFNEINTVTGISSPIIRSHELGDIFTFDSGQLYHIPNGNVLNGLGHPRKYAISDVSRIFTDANSGNARAMSMFVKVGATTYFLQDGNLFPITSAAITDWTNGSSVPNFASTNISQRFDIRSTPQLGNFIQEGNDKYVLNGGTAFYVGSYAPSYLPAGSAWAPVSIFGMPRAGLNSTIIRSTDNNDNRIFLLNKGTKQHILSGESLQALTRQGSIGITRLSPSLLNLYPQVNGGKDPVPLVYTEGQGFKLLTAVGTFYGFNDADTLVNFATGNMPIEMDGSSYTQYSQYVGAMTRLIKDPSGKVYWIENGKKRWITNGSAFQAYSGTPLTNVNWLIADCLPNGTTIQ